MRKRSLKQSRSRKLSHIKADGSITMVDVGTKKVTDRYAVAHAEVVMAPAALRMIRAGMAKKGDVLVTAQIAGILAAKQTSRLIPLCHPLPLNDVEIRCTPRGTDRLDVACRVATAGRTGVEMEALTGAAVAALTVYDMCKAVDRAMVIERLELLEKAGGKSGHFERKKRAR